MSRIPIVDYLVLEPTPHLRVQECTGCGARFFGRRNACASCGALDFAEADVAVDGVVTAFTIVSFAAPGIEVPFVAAVIDCDGTTVQANLRNAPADPEHVHLGQRVRLTTYSLGQDANNDEGIGFGFEAIEPNEPNEQDATAGSAA